VVGVVASVVQLLSALAEASRSRREADVQAKDPLEDARDQLARATFVFFAVCTAFSLVGLVSHMLLVRLPLYKLVIKGYHSRGGPKGKSNVSIFKVERKVRLLGFSVLYVFLVTICLFPSITSIIFPVSPPERGGIFQPAMFVPFGFFVFNTGDVRSCDHTTLIIC
jgi:equilibrative nucleoside transporter 1/2/3